jgi:hypothetical protein
MRWIALVLALAACGAGGAPVHEGGVDLTGFWAS